MSSAITDSVVERILSMPQSLHKDHFPELHHALTKIVQHREEVRPEISAAAIDAIIQINVITCPPIVESDWKASGPN
jgi:hypothetical protein